MRSWPILVELVIPLIEVGVVALGVAASTAVAIAAFVTSKRATELAERARQDELAREHKDERREFTAQAEAFIAERRRADADGRADREQPLAI